MLGSHRPSKFPAGLAKYFGDGPYTHRRGAPYFLMLVIMAHENFIVQW
jgi:hypothetical protein